MIADNAANNPDFQESDLFDVWVQMYELSEWLITNFDPEVSGKEVPGFFTTLHYSRGKAHAQLMKVGLYCTVAHARAVVDSWGEHVLGCLNRANSKLPQLRGMPQIPDNIVGFLNKKMQEMNAVTSVARDIVARGCEAVFADAQK